MGRTNLHKFKLDTKYPHKRSEGLRRVAHYPSTALICNRTKCGCSEGADVVEHPHITMVDGVPFIEGTRVPAQRLYDWHKKGVTMDTLFKRYPMIPRSHVLSAVAFFYDNPSLLKDT